MEIFFTILYNLYDSAVIYGAILLVLLYFLAKNLSKDGILGLIKNSFQGPLVALWVTIILYLLAFLGYFFSSDSLLGYFAFNIVERKGIYVLSDYEIFITDGLQYLFVMLPYMLIVYSILRFILSRNLRQFFLILFAFLSALPMVILNPVDGGGSVLGALSFYIIQPFSFIPYIIMNYFIKKSLQSNFDTGFSKKT